jgi:PAS domain-containing protein
LADSPATILQTLADWVLKALQADSAGLSLLTKDGKGFYWAAISGAWRSHTGGGTPRDFGPCGDVLDRNAPMLFTHWELRYPYLATATPLAEEGLLVPFFVKGKAVGTIWAIVHTSRRRFDAEDLRLLERLGQFASAAYQTVESTGELRIEIAARKRAETEIRQWTHRLEAKIQCLVDSNIIGIFILDREGRVLECNDAFLQVILRTEAAGHLSPVLGDRVQLQQVILIRASKLAQLLRERGHECAAMDQPVADQHRRRRIGYSRYPFRDQIVESIDRHRFSRGVP